MFTDSITQPTLDIAQFLKDALPDIEYRLGDQEEQSPNRIAIRLLIDDAGQPLGALTAQIESSFCTDVEVDSSVRFNSFDKRMFSIVLLIPTNITESEIVQ